MTSVTYSFFKWIGSRLGSAERARKGWPSKGPSRKRFSFWGLIAVSLSLWGCSVVPVQVREEADQSISLRELQRDPDAYLGRTVLLGGMIIKTTVLMDDGTELQVLQKPLGRRDIAIETSQTEGRFIVSYPGHLDPGVYQPGRYITTAGQVIGSVYVKVGEAEQRLPIIHSRFPHPWPELLQYYYGANYHPRNYPTYPYHPPYGDFYFDWFLSYPYPF
jgi:outer membrane lipoprotein